MFDLQDIFGSIFGSFFGTVLQDIISYFATALADISSMAVEVLKIPLVKNATTYAQSLAIAMLIIKAGSEAFQTYILHQNGDPDADPVGLLIRTGQAVAVISCLPWIVTNLFSFGNKISHDIATLGTGTPGIEDFSFIVATVTSTNSVIIVVFGILIVILILIVALQATIRGAELALMSILGPIMALNITANNRSVWSSWFRQLFIICTSQAVQIFMLSGVIPLLTTNSISNNGLLFAFGWLWVTIKSPKYIQQFVYSTGLGSAVGGTARQAGSMALMRIMMKK